jgi:Flp pilus assembly pilin Flp
MDMRKKPISELTGNEKGVAAIEFALIFPVIMLAVFGTAELLTQVYMRSNIHMLLRQATRDSIVASADMQVLEYKLRTKIEKLPGLHTGGELDIKICQEKGCSTAPVTVAEYTDLDASNTCNAPEKWQDKNRNGVKEKAGILVTGNTLGGPGEPVIFEVKAKARYFFGSLSFLGEKGVADQIQHFTVSAVGTNEDFDIPIVDC